MAEYGRFCDVAKVRIDQFFEVDIIMRDYHMHLAAEAEVETKTEEPAANPSSYISKLGFMALTSCCTSTTRA